MGIFNGTMSYSRFKVQGNLPTSYLSIYESAIILRRFIALKPDGIDNESYGFVSVQKPYDDQLQINNGHFLFDDKIALAFRHDIFTLPKSLFKSLVEQKISDHIKKTAQSPNNNLKRVFEATVKNELKQKILPKTKIIEFIWDINKKELRIFGRGKSTLEKFISLFEQTFQMKLILLNFSKIALETELNISKQSALEILKPYSIFNTQNVGN
jgi:hypothetical protein